jgi:hypothetical protein
MRNRCLLAIVFSLLALLTLAPMASAQGACVEREISCIDPVVKLCSGALMTEGLDPGDNCPAPPWPAGYFVRKNCEDAAGNICCGCSPINKAACAPFVLDSMTVQIYIQSDFGLTSIEPIELTNATVDPYSFSSGTTDPVTLLARKIAPAPARIVLEVCDTVECIQCDPIVTLVIRETGKPVRETFTNLPQAESKITVHNGRPGLRNLFVTVNGETFRMNSLKEGEERTIDAASAMLPGTANFITLTGTGNPGGEAIVVIHD